jgi:hypothetical protein
LQGRYVVARKQCGYIPKWGGNKLLTRYVAMAAVSFRELGGQKMRRDKSADRLFKKAATRGKRYWIAKGNGKFRDKVGIWFADHRRAAGMYLLIVGLSIAADQLSLIWPTNPRPYVLWPAVPVLAFACRIGGRKLGVFALAVLTVIEIAQTRFGLGSWTWFALRIATNASVLILCPPRADGAVARILAPIVPRNRRQNQDQSLSVRVAGPQENHI